MNEFEFFWRQKKNRERDDKHHQKLSMNPGWEQILSAYLWIFFLWPLCDNPKSPHHTSSSSCGGERHFFFFDIRYTKKKTTRGDC